jgi:cytochrome c
MSTVPHGLILAFALLAFGTTACASASFGDDGHLAAGKRLAQRDCGGCHATGKRGTSPNPDAPPFRLLAQRRYDVDDLARSIGDGMMVGHPRMPLITLGEDEIADLAAYVQSVQATTL